MYTVLVPVNTDEERALAQAKYVASLPGADGSVEAVLLFAFHEELGDDVPRDVGSATQSMDRIGSVRRAREYLAEHGVEVELVERSGDPADVILAAADEHDVDSIVLGGRKRSPAGKALFGSVTQSVILNSDVPTVVAGQQSD